MATKRHEKHKVEATTSPASAAREVLPGRRTARAHRLGLPARPGQVLMAGNAPDLIGESQGPSSLAWPSLSGLA
jgi:hypothetical protein